MRTVFALVLPGLALLAGCSGGESKYDSGIHPCVTDDDCPIGMFCFNSLCERPGVDGFDAGSDQAADPGSDPGIDAGSDPGSDPGPQDPPCARQQDCAPGLVCTYRSDASSVATVCREPSPGGATLGLPCSLPGDCQNWLCACDDHLCDNEPGTCSAICQGFPDCLAGTTCATVNIPDQAGAPHGVFACIEDSGACRRQDDCAAGRCCQADVGTDAILTHCNTDCPGTATGGEPCARHEDCLSGFCFYDQPYYCLDMCREDADCPVFDAGTDCATHADCAAGYLCQSDQCLRRFACRTIALRLNTGSPAIYGMLNACTPFRLPCEVNNDCRPDEACKLYLNEDATAAVFQCDAGGPGYGRLGEPCTDGCWSDICLGGAAGDYCSRACLTNLDCAPEDQFYCGSLRVDVRDGYVNMMPVCMRR